MNKGAPVIAQGALAHQGWGGRADILRRVEIPSALGEWSYEAIDTKLSRETKAGAVLQLSLYSDLLTQTQGAIPENMHVVAPWSDFQPRTYRFADYAAYFRKAKRGLLATLAKEERETYPEPNAHCEICRWRKVRRVGVLMINLSGAGISRFRSRAEAARHCDHEGAGRHDAPELEAGSRSIDP
jgi:uncharacterized protein